MQNPKSISELLKGGKRLSQLATRSSVRATVLEKVRGALSPALAAAVVSAGIENGQLTIGVAGAAWASRIRYLSKTARARLEEQTGIAAGRIRVRVVPPLKT
ncbi:MAG TPA: DciA family protein [Steroidobacteraceae bacterium]|jgi:hypothetical protein